LARFQKPVCSGGQMSCFSVLEDHLFPLYHHGVWPRNLRSILYGMLQGVAVLVDSSHACCRCVPSSELFLILCFSSMDKQCYVFHINFSFQMETLILLIISQLGMAKKEERNSKMGTGRETTPSFLGNIKVHICYVFTSLQGAEISSNKIPVDLSQGKLVLLGEEMGGGN